MSESNTSRFCTSCSQTCLDNGKGMMKQFGNKGNARWLCSSCVEHRKNRTYSFNFSNKNKAGRKPKPKEDYSLCDPIEDREFIRNEFGI